jgi:ribosomal protein S18 acetylase RimI-like enzyme
VTDSLIPDGSAKPESNQSLSAGGIRVRRASLTDLPALANLLTDSFHPSGPGLGWLSPVLQIGIYQDLRGRVLAKTPHYACLVAEKGWRVAPSQVFVGTVEVALRATFPWQPRTHQYPYISNLAVERRYRRQGVGQQLLLTCERVVRDWGFSDLYLHVLENNLTARHLYRKAGYQLQTVEPDWIQWLVGRPRRLLLRKQLS